MKKQGELEHLLVQKDEELKRVFEQKIWKFD